MSCSTDGAHCRCHNAAQAPGVDKVLVSNQPYERYVELVITQVYQYLMREMSIPTVRSRLKYKMFQVL